MRLHIRFLLAFMLLVLASSVFTEPQSWQAIKIHADQQQHVQQNLDMQKCYVKDASYISLATFKFLKNASHNWLSKNGSLQWLGNSHQLIICDDSLHFQRFNQVLQQLNHQPIQIKIKAKIISVDQSYLHDLGANFNTEANNTKQQQSSGDISKSGLHVVLASLRAQELLAVQLHALIEHGHAKMIANPTILTSNHIKANIESGQEVPYQQGALSGGTSVAFKKAVMQLAVTPDVVDKHQINLSIQVHQDKVTPATVNGVPIISTEQLNTHAIVKNHNLLMLGGIIEKNYSEQTEGVPFLRHLPIVGLLFQRHRKEMRAKELLILIQPSW